MRWRDNTQIYEKQFLNWKNEIDFWFKNLRFMSKMKTQNTEGSFINQSKGIH